MAETSRSRGTGAVPKPPPSLARLGLTSWEAIALHLPLRYEDETRLTPVADLQPGQTAQVEATVSESMFKQGPRPVLQAMVDDGSGLLRLRFLHVYPPLRRHFQPGARVRVLGQVRLGSWGLEMVHPRYRVIDPLEPEALAAELTPVYPSASGISQRLLRQSVQRAMACADLGDTLGDIHLDEASAALPDFRTALEALHRPATGTSLSALQNRETDAWRRVILDELVAQQLALRKARALRQQHAAPSLGDEAGLRSRLLASLPFTLTEAQQRCVDEITGDLLRPMPMQRLLQGDVGSGKTVVAALAACQAAGSGWQTALMAPTELLADQHFARLSPWLAGVGVGVVRLSGSQRKADRREALERLASGQASVAVGTHALIQEGVQFRRLGLAIIDEQHRFGVGQRLALKAKGGASAGAAEGGRLASEAALQPHQLAMSATPIPRTLAMSYLADLDVSVIDALPPGRTPIRTRIVSQERREEVVERLRAFIADGGQAYWVCPAIDADDDQEEPGSDADKLPGDETPLSFDQPDGLPDEATRSLQAVTEAYAILAAALPADQVGLLHGRLSAAEKAQTMKRFSEGQLGVLVATTVVEVGVDVPNASLMVVEQAEHFGLAQLHQLRGRVGRGCRESTCILMYRGPLSRAGRQRLQVLYETQDGFEVARRDLQIRGPGEFLGARQSGVPTLIHADLDRDADLVALARDLAEHLLARGDALVARHRDRWYADRQNLLQA